jgi:hypothetical protein
MYILRLLLISGTTTEMVWPRQANEGRNAEWKPQGKRKGGRPVNTRKDGIRESMKRRELKDEECMDRDLWRRKIMSLG